MSEKIRLIRKIGFQNMFYTKCINVIIDSIGPSIILRSIYIYTEEYSESTALPTAPLRLMYSVCVLLSSVCVIAFCK